MDKKHGKWARTLLKSERQRPYHIYWSPWRKLTQKTFPLMICKIFRFFVNTLTADNKYSFPNRDNLTQPIHILSQKEKNFSWFFFAFFEIYIEFETFPKKRWPSQLMYFRKYGLLKTWLHNCLNSSVWEIPLRSNMVHEAEHCWNLNNSTFTIFVENCEGNWDGKSLSE